MSDKATSLCERLRGLLGYLATHSGIGVDVVNEAAAMIEQQAARIGAIEDALRAVELARHTDAPDDWGRATKLTDAALKLGERAARLPMGSAK